MTVKPAASREVRAAAIGSYLDGHSGPAVAAHYGYSTDRVIHWVRAAGHNVRPPGSQPKPSTPFRVPEGADLSVAGVTVEEAVTIELVDLEGERRLVVKSGSQDSRSWAPEDARRALGHAAFVLGLHDFARALLVGREDA